MDTTTIQKALRHLRKDRRLRALIEKYPPPDFGTKDKRGAFEALGRAIIFQQLSGKAANTILFRFLELYDGKFPKLEELKRATPARLRRAGISAQKAGYLKDLAEKFIDGTIEPRKFRTMSDEDIRAHVVQVKGIGPWTADMFLMFTLVRPDVLPVGDLGIQNGFKKLFALKARPEVREMETLAEPWRPYRTIACWYLWRLADEGNQHRPR